MFIKWLREPLLHFLLIGGLLFLLYGVQNDNVIDNNRISVSKADINRLISRWEKQRHRLPTKIELQSLIEQQIHEEVMYREALAMGLDKNDTIVRRRLAQKVEFISSDIAALVEPTDKELTEYLDAHPEKFETRAHLSFEHIYFNSDKRGARTEADAALLLGKLNQSNPAIDISTAGDPFMMGQKHDKISEHEVSRLFGKDFAAKLFTLDAGSWQGPVVSGYGLHLIRIDNKALSEPAELTIVKDKVRIEWQAEQRRTINKAFYENLRQRYDIVIESIPGKEKLARTNP